MLMILLGCHKQTFIKAKIYSIKCRISHFTEYCKYFLFSCSSSMGIPAVQLFFHDFISCGISTMHAVKKVLNIEINVKLTFFLSYCSLNTNANLASLIWQMSHFMNIFMFFFILFKTSVEGEMTCFSSFQ